jgi:hydroxypyruvate reductase
VSGSLREDADRIWSAGLAAVAPERLVADHASVIDATLTRDTAARIMVVGGGKAAAGIAAGIETLLGPDALARQRVSGLVSVPEGCGRRLSRIEIRETRPAGLNLPTPEVVKATAEMLTAVGGLGPDDLVIVPLTGGGSALLAAPKDGVTLDEKIAVTRSLSESGADIARLNAARQALSRVKGGGLARACTAGRMLVLVLSDVIGDDLHVIASGPCMPGLDSGSGTRSRGSGAWTTPRGCTVEHILLGGNGTAVAAAADAARRAGYDVVSAVTRVGGETAEEVGRRLAAEAARVLAATAVDGRPRAIIEGGEAVVRVPADHGRGGRNQQTVVAAVEAVCRGGGSWPEGLLIASIGSDGEDGPTDAAGGIADASVAAEIERGSLDLPRALARCDAYPLLDSAGGLVRTGPTGTNVADLRIVLTQPARAATAR